MRIVVAFVMLNAAAACGGVVANDVGADGSIGDDAADAHDAGVFDSAFFDVVITDAKLDGHAPDATTTCAATLACPVISPNGITFDVPPCGPCDNCSATSCCASMTTCFADVDGGPSDCAELFACYVACANADGGASCPQACEAAYGHAAVTAFQAASDCQSTSCSAQCN